MKTSVKIIEKFLTLISFLKPKKVDKSGVCPNCHENIQNIGGHIDMCIDRKIWKIV